MLPAHAKFKQIVDPGSLAVQIKRVIKAREGNILFKLIEVIIRAQRKSKLTCILESLVSIGFQNKTSAGN